MMKITSALNLSKEIPITDTDVRHLKHNFRFMIAPSQYYFDAIHQRHLKENLESNWFVFLIDVNDMLKLNLLSVIAKSLNHGKQLFFFAGSTQAPVLA